jgi:hypothetical protein
MLEQNKRTEKVIIDALSIAADVPAYDGGLQQQ